MNNNHWKKGAKLSYNGKKVIISHIFPDGSADIIDAKTHKLLGKIAKPFAANPSIEILNPEQITQNQNKQSLTVKDFNSLMDANEEYFNLAEKYEEYKDTPEASSIQAQLKAKEQEIASLEKNLFN
jgi:hypothetical protein